MSDDTAFDVVILGAGPAGCAAALTLARLGKLRVRLVSFDAGDGLRVGETLLPDTRVLLEQLQLWDQFLQEEHLACLGSCAAWGSEELGYNDFLLNMHARGWHLDRRRFDRFLLHHAGLARGVELSYGKFRNCEPAPNGGYYLALDRADGASEVVAGRYVIDATGHHAAFARKVGARVQQLDCLLFVYGFFAAADTRTSSTLTLLEAAEYGWWYAAHLPGGRVAVACATDPETLKQQGLSDEAVWLDRAQRQRHLKQRLDGHNYLPGSLCVRAAASFRLDQVMGRAWLAIGDAAAVFDPLAAQGIHKALEDGIAAGLALATVAEHGGAIPAAVAQAHRDRFDEYLANRDYFYALEQRWAKAPFWTRRSPGARLDAK